MTIKNQILDAITDAAAPLSPYPVTRCQRQTEKTPAFSVWDNAGDAVVEVTSDSTMRRALVQLEGLLKPRGENDSTAANELVAQAQQAILTDQTLGGLVREISEADYQITYPDTGRELIAIVLRFNVIYEVKTGDPYSLPDYLTQ